MPGWAAPGFSEFANAHAAFWSLPLVSGLWSLVSGLWSLVSGLWTLARALAHRHAVGGGFIFLVEVGVHEEGEQGGEAVEGGVGEVLLFLPSAVKVRKPRLVMRGARSAPTTTLMERNWERQRERAASA